MFVIAILVKNYNQLGQITCRQRMGSLYTDLKTSSKASLGYNVEYLIRRLLFVVVALVCASLPFLQVQFFLFQCILQIIYLLNVRPFSQPIFNYLEVFNELCITAAGYHLIVFTGFVADSNTQYMVGWSLIGLTVLNILTNMIIMLYNSFQMLRTLCRKYKRKWCTKKAQKRQQESSILTNQQVNRDNQRDPVNTPRKTSKPQKKNKITRVKLLRKAARNAIHDSPVSLNKDVLTLEDYQAYNIEKEQPSQTIRQRSGSTLIQSTMIDTQRNNQMDAQHKPAWTQSLTALKLQRIKNYKAAPNQISNNSKQEKVQEVNDEEKVSQQEISHEVEPSFFQSWVPETNKPPVETITPQMPKNLVPYDLPLKLSKTNNSDLFEDI